MTEYFMSKVTVKKIVIVREERFMPPGYKEPVEVRPVSITSLLNMGDLSNHTLYLYPTPGDRESNIFRVFLSTR
jgi:hypothetical protein